MCDIMQLPCKSLVYISALIEMSYNIYSKSSVTETYREDDPHNLKNKYIKISSRRKQSYCYYNFVTINISCTLLLVNLTYLHTYKLTYNMKQNKSENIYIYKNVFIFSKERHNGNPKWP